MRLNDRRDGSIKALLILGLLLANIAVSFSHRSPDSSKRPTAGARSEMSSATSETRTLRPSPHD